MTPQRRVSTQPCYVADRSVIDPRKSRRNAVDEIMLGQGRLFVTRSVGRHIKSIACSEKPSAGSGKRAVSPRAGERTVQQGVGIGTPASLFK